jgi:branched-chain amino acid transport system permease protein
VQLFLQRIFDGLNNGAVYAVVAIALVLIFKATTLVNFAQASMAMFGTYLVWMFVEQQHWGIWFAIAVAMVISAIAGAAIERVLIRPFDPTDHLPLVMITFGLAAILEAIAGWKWGLEFHKFPSPFPSAPGDYIGIGGARLRYETVGTLLMMFAMIGAVFLILNKTKIGLAFRAVSSTLESSRLVGVKVGPTLMFGWALAAALGTLGGAMVARQTNLEPAFMAKLVIFSFAAAVLGGLDSIGGAVIGAFIVAMIQSLLVGYAQQIPGLHWMKSNYSLVIAFVVILVVLLFKPAGLFGTKRIERV